MSTKKKLRKKIKQLKQQRDDAISARNAIHEEYRKTSHRLSQYEFQRLTPHIHLRHVRETPAKDSDVWWAEQEGELPE